MMTVPQAFDLAVQHHQAGRLAEAEALYRQILAVQPKHADALHLLGVIAHQRGQQDLAVTLIRQAIEMKPDFAAAYYNLGNACKEQGHMAEAVAAYRRATELQPHFGESHNNLGAALVAEGRHDDAIAAFRRALQVQPDFTAAYSNLGNALTATGQFQEAVAAYSRAVQLQPGQAGVYDCLGNALRFCGRLDEAIAAHREAIRLQPEDAMVQSNLAVTLTEHGQLDEAIAVCRHALECGPGHAEMIHNNLGMALAAQRRFDEALDEYHRALALQPDYPDAQNNLANALKNRGQIEEAIAAYRRALEFRQGWADVHSNLAYTLHFHPSLARGAIVEEQQRWNRLFGKPGERFIPPRAKDRRPERRLRIGYVSPDFCDHVVGRNLRPLLEHHDDEALEVVCYSGALRPDQLTEAFRRDADQWCGTVGLGDAALTEMIRQDGIDILVDLTQHMAGNRLTVFARKPAPVQVSFAGYPESTGLEAIEYRISDRWLESEIGDRRWEIGWKREPDLPSSTSDLRAERVFLIDSFWCYDPCGMEVEVNALPAKESGPVTFGCLNNFCKVNEPLLKLWARVLGKVPQARLVILSGFGSHPQRTLEVLEREGVASDRVEFVELRPRKAYLELYHQLDIVLDTYPYNGHTTSLDALWMGVPVVSLAGERPVSRAGLSQLSNLGLPELAAHSQDEYVEIAARLACDLPRLAELRRTLRARMEASVLMDGPRFTRNIETAYRAMWRRWCAEKTDA